MSAKSLAEKLKLKSGLRSGLVNAPPGYTDELSPPKDVKLNEGLDAGPFDWLQIFVHTSADLKSIAPKLKRALKPAGLLWITYPKGTSGTQTDLTRDKGWEPIRPLELKWVALISVTETWSAFALRPYKEGEKRQSFR